MTTQPRHNVLPIPTDVQERMRASGPLAKRVMDLLESPDELRGMADDLQGRFIVDRFLGDLVATQQSGGLEGASHPVALDSILRAIKEKSAAVERGEGDLSPFRAITGASGLRFAVIALHEDPRTKPLLDKLGMRLEKDEEGGPRLNRLPQLEGYLFGISKGARTSWLNTLVEQVAEYANVDSETPRKPWDRHNGADLLSADLQGVRERQQKWDEAIQEAERAGVDPDLVTRSAEAIREFARLEGTTGHVAMSGVFPDGYAYMVS